METIQAQVSASILKKADRLFTNNLSHIFIELLQNARRAGATTVSVITNAVDGGTQISFIDNGCGIDDFGKLLHLGDSAWDENTERAEDPAGMGFFSLLHSGVTVRSKGKQAVITKEAFFGQVPVSITDSAIASLGTVLLFHRHESEKTVEDALTSAALYGSIKVILNGKLLETRDFLGSALHVKEVNGVRIGVMAGSGDYVYNCNFYGNQITTAELRDLSLRNVLVPGPDFNRGLSVAIDVVEASRLHLKLPDRSAVVEDEAFRSLLAEARRTLLEYLATFSEHTAPFVIYEEAHELGIDLKEAAPYLKPFYVAPYDASSLGNRPFGGFESDAEARLQDLGRIAIVDMLSDTDNPPAFAFDVACRSHSIPTAFSPSWKVPITGAIAGTTTCQSAMISL